MSDKPEFDYTLDDVARLSRSERESRVTDKPSDNPSSPGQQATS